MSLSSRDVLRSSSISRKDAHKSNCLHDSARANKVNDYGICSQNSLSRPMINLELYALINPLVFWLDYSIERPDRLPLFKLVWKTLNTVLDQLPKSKAVKIDILEIITPVLQRVD